MSLETLYKELEEKSSKLYWEINTAFDLVKSTARHDVKQFGNFVDNLYYINKDDIDIIADTNKQLIKELYRDKLELLVKCDDYSPEYNSIICKKNIEIQKANYINLFLNKKVEYEKYRNELNIIREKLSNQNKNSLNSISGKDVTKIINKYIYSD